jgi:hypothetical protein
MTHQTIDVALRRTDGTTSAGELELDSGKQCRIRLKWSDGRAEETLGNDLFDCLCLLRERLEPDGWLIMCEGARVDVYPSGMSREMGAGRRAYVLRLGEHADRNDLVDIFAATKVAQLASVRDQRAYFEKWIESVRNMSAKK